MDLLASETARLVLSYTLDQHLPATSKQLVSECRHLAELANLPPAQLRRASRVGGRSLQDVLREFQDIVDAITEIAETIPGEGEELRFERPLRIVKRFGDLLKRGSSGPSAPTCETGSQAVLAVASSSTQTASCSPQLKALKQLNTSHNTKPAQSSSNPPLAASSGGFFHPNIRVPPAPRPSPVPILPRPAAAIVSPTVPAPPPSTARVVNNENLGALTPGIPVSAPSSTSTPCPTSSGSRKKRPTKAKKTRQSDEDFLDELLGGVGGQIASLIPQDVDSQNISDIAELGLDNPEIYENLLNALEEMGGGDEDSEVNTPPTSPLAPEIREENTSEETEAPIEGHNDEEAQLQRTINPVLDKLATIVNSTIKDVTEDFESTEAARGAESQLRKRKRKSSPQKAKDPSKAVKKPKVVGGLGYLAKQCRSLLQSEEANEAQGSQLNKPPTSSLNNQSTPLVLKLAQVARSSGPLVQPAPPEEEEEVKEEEKEEGIVCTPDQPGIAVGKKENKRRGPRCKKCPGCLRDDCGECRTCRDKPKFGGTGILKQACLLRSCQGFSVVQSEGASTQSETRDKENAEIAPMPSPGHVRSLMFSPPTPQKSVLKTLTPEKNSSPIKRTSAAWNKEIKDIFSEPAASIQSSIPFTEEVVKGLNRPITVNRRIHIPITLPSEARLVPIPASAIPVNAAITTLPPGFKSLGFQAIVPQSIAPASSSSNSVPAPLTTVTSNPEVKSSTTTMITPHTTSTNTKHAAPMVSVESSALRAVLKSPSPPSSEPPNEPPAKPLSSTKLPTSKDSAKIMKPDSTIATTSKTAAPISSSSTRAATTSAKPPMSWDEKLRASLGAAEKDMSHISHRLQPREKGRRRSPRKRRPVDKPESEDEFDEEEDGDDGEGEGGNPPVLDLNDATITPDAQKILDTFANKLLVKLEENVAMNVVQIGDASEEGKKGKKHKSGADCICCKLEAVSSRSKRPTKASGKSHSSVNTSNVSVDTQESSSKIVNDGESGNGGMPIIASPAKTKTPRSSGKRSSVKKSIGVSDVEREKEKNLEGDNDIEKEKLASEAAPKPTSTTPKPASTTPKPTSTNVEPEPCKPPEVVEEASEDQLDSLIQSFDSEAKESTEPTPAPPMTPKKSDTFVFKTPIKTPSRRHIPPSPLQHLLSPRTSRMAVPLTPGRPTTPSYAPSLLTPAKSDEEMERSRHPSSLDTPVLSSPPKDLPVTPTGKVKGGAAYFTPSPGSQPSPVATPGLRFLQEEGQRLSECSEDSQSPQKARELQNRRKSFRNLFKKSTSESEELGTILENKLTSINFKTANSTPGSPFMSPAADYAASPQIHLGRPSPSSVSENHQGMDRHGSFVSPNRTCYLSPTAMALSSSVLGFHQSPTQGDSDITDGEQEKEFKQKHNKAAKAGEEIENFASALDPMERETESDKYQRIHEDREKAEKRKKSDALQETEESIEAIGAYVTSNLSDESNTASLPPGGPGGVSIQNLESAPLTFSNLSNSRPDLSEDSESSESDDSSSDSGEDMEEDEEDKTTVEIKPSPTSFRKTRSFVESFLTVESKDTKADVKATAPVKERVPTPQKKPRRVALTSFKRKSPIKNGATSFESANDANNLDKVTGGDSSKVFESGSLGKEASFDLGLEERGFEEPEALKTVSVISTRKSPRKRSGNMLEPKKLQPDHLSERTEVELNVSPVKLKKARQSDAKTPEVVNIKTPERKSTNDCFGKEKGENIKPREVSLDSKSRVEDNSMKGKSSNSKPEIKDIMKQKGEPLKVQKIDEKSKQSKNDALATMFLKSLESSGKSLARIPKIPKKPAAAVPSKPEESLKPARRSARGSPQKVPTTSQKDATPKKKKDAKPVSLFEKPVKETFFPKPSSTPNLSVQPNVDQMAKSAADILSTLGKLPIKSQEKNPSTKKIKDPEKSDPTQSKAIQIEKKESKNDESRPISHKRTKSKDGVVASVREAQSPTNKKTKSSAHQPPSKEPDDVKKREQSPKPDSKTQKQIVANVTKPDKEALHPLGWKVSSFFVFNNKLPFGVFEEDLQNTS